MAVSTISHTETLFRTDPAKAQTRPTVTASLANGRARLSAGPFNWDADLPTVLGGENLAPSPTAYLLGALAGCAVAGDTTGNIVGVDPLLGSLAANGGVTRTQALLPGSAAVDAGGSTTCTFTDQRGVGRPAGAVCDIGAYELGFVVNNSADGTGRSVTIGATSLTGTLVNGATVTYANLASFQVSTRPRLRPALTIAHLTPSEPAVFAVLPYFSAFVASS